MVAVRFCFTVNQSSATYNGGRYTIMELICIIYRFSVDIGNGSQQLLRRLLLSQRAGLGVPTSLPCMVFTA
jgi:hypothetical protein